MFFEGSLGTDSNNCSMFQTCTSDLGCNGLIKKKKLTANLIFVSAVGIVI